MPPLNPYLRAFFKSNIPSQCKPVQDHVLLVPTTDTLLNSRDDESGSLYTDLAGTDEFLASHVLRIPTSQSLQGDGMRIGGRETRAKPRQFSTVNGRTVIVRDSWVHSKSGFKTHQQAQILTSILFSPDVIEPQQWLVYFISKPLIGSAERISLIPQPTLRSSPPQSARVEEFGRKKKDIGSFQELMANYPQIQRQLQPGLNQVLLALEEELLRTPTPPRVSSSGDSTHSSESYAGSEDGDEGTNLLGSHSDNQPSRTAVSKQPAEEPHLLQSFQTAIAEATALFQHVDRTHLSHLASSTSLTDHDIDRLLERYIAEQVHDHILFPRIRASKEVEDAELTRKVWAMRNVDLSQVGVGNVTHKLREGLESRITRGVEEFSKLASARSPQAAVQIMLKAARALTAGDPVVPAQDRKEDDEKASVVTINADMLVSLLLLVVIRARVPSLGAWLSYMRTFVLAEDVEQGETGYVLSTFEAVLCYIGTDEDGLEEASRRNGELWRAVRTGDLATVKRILEPETQTNGHTDDVEMEMTNGVEMEMEVEMSEANGVGKYPKDETGNDTIETADDVEMLGARTAEDESSPIYDTTTASASRTSLSRSLVSSVTSLAALSRTYSNQPNISAPSVLAHARTLAGDSLLTLSINSRRPEILAYLLHCPHFSPAAILSDTSPTGATLLSSAIQTGECDVIETLIDRLIDIKQSGVPINRYLNKPDNSGRTPAHYLFNAPAFIPHLGLLLSWTVRDKNGQTPLLALFRSYDHPDYTSMCSAALRSARLAQRDQQPLHVEDHIDNKGNTLLHVASETRLVEELLREDVDVNAGNERGFTPLMVMAKFGRVGGVRSLWRDGRVESGMREKRGLTAVELAKDEDVRTTLDDLAFLDNPPNSEGHIVSAIRTFFLDDSSTRFLIKAGTPNPSGTTITIRTCRRSLQDFLFIADLLALESPASWLPPLPALRSPVQLPSKPSRAILNDLRASVDFFLRALLDHPTFGTHELLWEFFVVPEVRTEAAKERSQKKAQARRERVREEVAPVTDTREVDVFVNFAKDTLRGVSYSYRSLVRRVNTAVQAHHDLETATAMLPPAFREALPFLPVRYGDAVERLVKCYEVKPSCPYALFLADVRNMSATLTSFLSSLDYPKSLIGRVSTLNSQISKLRISSLQRQKKPALPFGLLEDSRAKSTHRDEVQLEQKREEVEETLRELTYTKGVVAQELAGLERWRGDWVRSRVRELAKGMVKRETERLEQMKRALRVLNTGSRDTRKWQDLTKVGDEERRGRRRRRDVDEMEGELPMMPVEDVDEVDGGGVGGEEVEGEVEDCTALPPDQVDMVQKLDRLFDL
ncbi:hypothetical protein BJ508DRAFT_416386 [Ascobolus immersus RN42]|uniref:VPS9 domain-containing protein n=1 Tax=Ascobolus immersus RN42 TaxID=1160509 RepID=A0A3N4HY65_ASCIM|nr:hypothetical protein BJ508DRAFT_416386 [Ascobolus immersus RN42]